MKFRVWKNDVGVVHGLITPICVIFLITSLFLPSRSEAEDITLSANSLIIPMDIQHQDMGMFRAYGLVYKLLQNGIPVKWCILPGKNKDDIDFTVSSVADAPAGGNTLFNEDYRGGPFVVSQDYYDQALPIVQAWQTDNPDVVVHRALSNFTCPRSRHLIAAPSIAVFADGKEDIAFKYLNAAGIPDSLGQTWPTKKDKTKQYPGYPDVLNETEVAGPTTTDHRDGALFDSADYPTYCQFMSMHYNVNKRVPEVIAEVNEFLQFPVHFMAECQAVNAFENDANGHFLTTGGLDIGVKPDASTTYSFYQQDNPFTQLSGTFVSVGGSEPSYTLKSGSQYYANVTVNITMDTATGENDVWINGRWKGDPTKGRVSYLGGHKYEVKLPISANPKSQGTRLFLNSLFEAPCATAEAAPLIQIDLSGPTLTTQDTWTYTITVSNQGTWRAGNLVVRNPLPPGLSFVSADNGGTFDGTNVSWSFPVIRPGETLTLHFTVQATSTGTFTDQATAYYNVGTTPNQMASNTLQTKYGIYDIYRDVAPNQVVSPPNMIDVVTGNSWTDPTSLDSLPGLVFYKVAFQGNDSQTPVILVTKVLLSGAFHALLSW